MALSREIGRILHGFSSVEYPDWKSVFDNLDRFAGERVTLFIDEFPCLVQNGPELPSVLQRFIDLPKKNKIDIVLCGSSQRMMYGFALKAASPLYGRAHQIIHIKPLKAGWISEALGKKPEESVGAYAVFGGVPRLDIKGIEWNVAARWWGKAPDKNPIEIDIAAESLDKKSLLIGEVKWSDSPDMASIAASLEQKARYMMAAGDNKKEIVYAVWTKKAVTGNGKVHQITPEVVLERVR